MSGTVTYTSVSPLATSRGLSHTLETLAAWLLALLWVLPLVYALWTALHPTEYSAHFLLSAPWTFDNLVHAWHAAPFARYFVNTVLLVTMVLVVQFVLATLAAYAFARYRFPGRNVLIALSLGPLILPALVTGIGLLILLQLLGLSDLLGFPALVAGHVVICTPFVVRMTAIGLSTLPTRVEDAAMSLGARPSVIVREITFPLIKGGLFAGATFAFIQSFTDYSMSLFLSSPTASPITLTILNSIEFGFTPTLAAVAVVTLVIPLILVLAVQRFFKVGDFILGSSGHG
jgi:ABC-type spermidine/putrescine transport system permease subunit II